MSKATNDDVRASVREQYGGIARGAASACCAPGSCGPEANASLALGYSAEDLAAVPSGLLSRTRALRPGTKRVVVVDDGAGAA